MDRRWARHAGDVEQAADYQLTAEGEWFDAWVNSDADGYDSKGWSQQHFESALCLPTTRWFCLVGVIDRELDAAFQIGC
ncbi:hypothetical protein N5I84_09195 [Ralstonia sp. CHL-2022]|uniref:hypothetical protein n=1 Tax=Ralstonia mojiangensis TaxID=2953895 RepID=UPI0021B4D2EC|nr:hypothetical protein [Ralstonia mojiangensis]MCT7296337.1 hypothetical protein [Ralstonia mojiangensis]